MSFLKNYCSHQKLLFLTSLIMQASWLFVVLEAVESYPPDTCSILLINITLLPPPDDWHTSLWAGAVELDSKYKQWASALSQHLYGYYSTTELGKLQNKRIFQIQTFKILYFLSFFLDNAVFSGIIGQSVSCSIFFRNFLSNKDTLIINSKKVPFYM